MRKIVVSLYAALACRYTDLNANDCNHIDFWFLVGTTFMVLEVGIYTFCRIFIQILQTGLDVLGGHVFLHALLLYGIGK